MAEDNFANMIALDSCCVLKLRTKKLLCKQLEVQVLRYGSVRCDADEGP